jgi:hypothetical protein
MANTKNTSPAKPASAPKPTAASKAKASTPAVEAKPVVAETAASAPASSPEPVVVAVAPAPVAEQAKPVEATPQEPVKATRTATRKPKAKVDETVAETAVADQPAEESLDDAEPTQGEIDRMIAEAAYYLAEKRSFQPGFEEEDWATATEQVLSGLRGEAS